MFYNFLNELASHGFFVISNGSPKGSGSTSANDLITSLDWATKNPNILQKYGNVDTSTVIAAGQSCGTWQSVSMIYLMHTNSLSRIE